MFVALRVIDTLKTLLAPFLPFTCQALHGYLGYDGDLFGTLYTETLHESAKSHLALRYEGSTTGQGWTVSNLQPGQSLREPKPLFLKLEPSIVEEEIERMMTAT